MISLADFISQYTGQTNVGDTDQNKGQCVGLVMVWLVENLGRAHIWANAIDLLKSAEPYRDDYTVIYNTPTNAPSAGDVIVFGKPFGPYTTTDANGNHITAYNGHTAIVVKADINTVTVFEQNDHDSNDPTGACQVKTYPYIDQLGNHIVLGWIHPNNLPATETVPVPPTTEQLQNQLKDALEAASTCQNQLKTANDTISSEQQQINQLQDDKNKLQSMYDAEHKENLAFISEVATFTTDRKHYADASELAKTQAAQYAEWLHTIAAHAGVDTKGLTDDEQVTNNILAEISQLTKENEQLKKQNQTLSLVKSAVSQTTGVLPSSPVTSPLRKLLNWLNTQL